MSTTVKFSILSSDSAEFALGKTVSCFGTAFQSGSLYIEINANIDETEFLPDQKVRRKIVRQKKYDCNPLSHCMY